MKLRSLMIVYERLNGLADRLLEAGMLIKNELLGKLCLTRRQVVLRHVTDEEEAKNILEKIYVFICKVMDQLFELLPGNTLATDVDVGEEKIKFMLGLLWTLRILLLYNAITKF